jgi:hypothetical protein
VGTHLGVLTTNSVEYSPRYLYGHCECLQKLQSNKCMADMQQCYGWSVVRPWIINIAMKIYSIPSPTHMTERVERDQAIQQICGAIMRALSRKQP